MRIIRKLALTAYGRVYGESIRCTLALTTAGHRFVRADGSNAVLPFLPDLFRTSGDVVSVAATMVDTFSMQSYDWDSLPAHGWKSTYTLDEALAKFGIDAAIADELRAAYDETVELAA